MIAKKLFSIIGILWGVAACAGSTIWQGEYVYEADLGENVAEQPILVEYVLSLGDESCQLSVQGYQVVETILCSADSSEKRLNIHFQSYEDGSVKNAYGIEIYKAGQRLFWLDDKLMTHWDAMIPDDSVIKPGKYFLKKAQ